MWPGVNLIGGTSAPGAVPCRRLLRTLTLAALAVAAAVPPAGAQASAEPP